MNKEQTKKTSKALTVNTTYARVAVMLLAFNFLLNGYLLLSFMQVQTPQSDGMSYATPPIAQARTLTTTKEEQLID